MLNGSHIVAPLPEAIILGYSLSDIVKDYLKNVRGYKKLTMKILMLTILLSELHKTKGLLELVKGLEPPTYDYNPFWPKSTECHRMLAPIFTGFCEGTVLWVILHICRESLHFSLHYVPPVERDIVGGRTFTVIAFRSVILIRIFYFL